MKTYRGLVRLKCKKKTCKQVLKDIIPDCFFCKDVKVEIIDLENKLLKTRSKKNGR